MISTNPGTRRATCVVVGAGVLGVISAYRLAQAGVEVTLVEAVGLGAGTSGASFSHVNASYAGYWPYVELRRAGLDGFVRLREELGETPWWHDTGYLAVYSPVAEAMDDADPFGGLDEHVDRLLALGYPVERIDSDPGTAEPALGKLRIGRALRFPLEGYVDLPAMLEDLSTRLVELGVTVLTGDPVVSVRSSGARISGVELESGRTVSCDRLVACCGRWTDDLLATAGLDTRLVALHEAAGTPVPGLLVVSSPVEASVTQVVSVDDINYRPMDRLPGDLSAPLPSGWSRTMVWSGIVDRELRDRGGPEADDDVVHKMATGLLGRAGQHVPALQVAEVERVLVTQRAMPADGLPVVGPVPGVDGLYVVLAHAAATLAPALGDAVATEVAHGLTDQRLERFRPSRFDNIVVTVDTPSGTNRQGEDVHDLAGHN